MAAWICDPCSISVEMNNRDSHLAGKRHKVRMQELLAANGSAASGKGKGIDQAHSNGIAESSNTSSSNRLSLSESTPANHRKQNGKSYPSGKGFERANTHNSSIARSKTREHGTQASDGPAIVQANPPALAAFEFTAEEIAKPIDSISAYGSCYVLVWECKPCYRWMPLSSKAAHLVTTAHIERLLQSFTISSPVVAPNQINTGVQMPMHNMSSTQVSNSILHTPRSSPTKPQQDNTRKPQEYSPQLKKSPKSKPKSAKPGYKYNALQPLGLPIKENRTTATTPPGGSISKLTVCTRACPRCRTVLVMDQKAAHSCALPGASRGGPGVGPLDQFFRSFPSFLYDAHEPPAESFDRLMSGLSKWNDWDGRDPASWKEYRKDVKERHQAALTHEFNLWFGTEDRIECWHALCRAVRVRPLPLSCDACRLAIRGLHVNIVDLIAWAREGETGNVQLFNTVKELSDYSYKNDKIYSRNQRDAGAVLSHLLREIRKEQRGQICR